MKKILVNFMLFYLRIAAWLQLKKFNPYILGVGGASGKTSLSNFIYIIFKNSFITKQGKGKNSETGIPLDVLDISIKSYSTLEWLKILFLVPLRLFFNWKRVEVYIAEMGIDSPLPPKNMSYLLKIVKPSVGVLTNISYEHSQYFDPLVDERDEKEREKDILELTKEQEGLLLTSLSKNDIAILNIDDENIVDLENSILANKITVSAQKHNSDFYIEKIQNFVNRFETTFKFQEKKYKVVIKNPLPAHFAYSFVLAIAASSTKIPDIQQSINALERNFMLPAGRMSVFQGIKDTIIFDSSYNNATLSPILDLLDFVKEIGGQRRRTGIIGDMRELGTMSKALHEEVARKILKTLDQVILIGPLTQKFMEPILKKDNFPVYSFVNFTDAKTVILEEVKPKDLILIKGSQNTLFLERAVELLLKDKQDIQYLCRRGAFWDNIRSKTL